MWSLKRPHINLVRSLQGNRRPRPLCIDRAIARLISYLLYDLFSAINIKHRKLLGLQSIKTNNWSADNFEKTRHFSGLYTWARDTVMWLCSANTFFDSCQLTITWMSTIKSNTDCICLGHKANNARSLKGNIARSAANWTARTIVAI